MNQVITEVDALRNQYQHEKSKATPEFLQQFKHVLTNTRFLRHEAGANAFIADMDEYCVNGGERMSLSHTKQHINMAADSFVFSIFKAPYFPSLSIEGFFYGKIHVDENFLSRYNSVVTPVIVKNASQGFLARVVVALFPENHIDQTQLPHDRIFYFIDKFVDRFYKITKKMIAAISNTDLFDFLLTLNQAEIVKLATYWVYLHEYHHHMGHLPIPEYLALKSLKPLAGLEELRVDLCGILSCIEQQPLGEKYSYEVALFILAERLLRYAVEGIPHPNYDAIASQMLFNFLVDHAAIKIQHGKINITNKVWPAVKAFAKTIEVIESNIKTNPAAEVQQQLLQFTRQYANFDVNTGTYRHIPYFEQVKKTLFF